MSKTPETRLSLLLRLRDRADHAAWEQFVQIYRPLIYRLARRKGLQHADAEDLAQHVLMAVMHAIGSWEPNRQRGRFSTWLHRVAQNAIINALSRARPDRGAGDSKHVELLAQQPAPAGPDSDLVHLKYRRELFRWAAWQVRAEFRPDTWQAFWLSTVEGLAVEDVARRVGKSVGAVYAARSRIVRRIRELVADLEEHGA